MIQSYQLRPVELKPYDPRAPQVADLVAKLIYQQLSQVRVEHIGSTSVPGCVGKGVIDLMVLYKPGELEQTKLGLATLGFQPQQGKEPFPEHRPMRVGTYCYQGSEFRLHVHVLAEVNEEVRKLRAFRDQLRLSTQLVNNYVVEKQRIVASGITDSPDYAQAKTHFIQQALAANS